MADQRPLIKADWAYPWGPPIFDTVFNRSGAVSVVGGCYQFDTGLTTAAEVDASLLPAVTDFDRSEKGAFSNVIFPLTINLYNGMYCVAQEAKNDNKPMKVVVVGDSNCLLITAAGAITLEVWGKLVPQNGSVLFNGFTGAGAGVTATGKLVAATMAQQITVDGVTQYLVPSMVQGLFGWR